MSDFEPRPKGTVIYGAFDAFAQAERALRVLRNAGYARAAFESDYAGEHTSDEPTVLVVDAAAAGALRAEEILEEFGARIRFAGREPPSATAARAERKPRVRKRPHVQVRQPPTAPSEPLAWDNVIIVTRPIESFATD